MARRRVRAESRARYYIREEAAKRGWDVQHVGAGGDCLEENEIVAHLPDVGLGLDKPDFMLCLAGAPALVLETKNEAGKLSTAVEQAMNYADQVTAAGRYDVRIAVGAAGEEDTGLLIEVRFRSETGWVPLTAYASPLTTVPSKREAELAINASDGTTTVSVPDAHEFIDAAIELSSVLRSAKVEAPLRPKVIGAIVMAMYEGGIDISPGNALASVNTAMETAVSAPSDLSPDTTQKLVDALSLSSADFDRLAPSIGRVVAILRRLNVRAVLQTDTDFLGMFYEAFLRYGYDNNALGIVFTPRHITTFCAELLDVSPTDRVVDIASGTGGFLVAAFDRMMAAAKSPQQVAKVKASIRGFDTNPTVWALSTLNMFFRGDGKSNMQLGSCFMPDNRRKVRQQFTRAFLNPPFSQEYEPERDFVDAAMDALEPEGLGAAVVYAGIFADDHHRAWRESFLRRHSLLAMISLPEDLFYPTAAPTSIVIARAHVPQRVSERVLMARVWNDGFEKLKNRRVERPGSQLPAIAEAFRGFLAGNAVTTELATTVTGGELRGGAEWSPQEWLPQPHVSAGELAAHQQDVIRSVYQAVARMTDLADEALEGLGDAWSTRPGLPTDQAGQLSDFFDVLNGRSTGEKNYAEGVCPYVSSGDAGNSIIRLISPVDDELFTDGGITVTAFGAACVQPWPFMARGNGGSAVRVLIPRYDMSVPELVWFAAQINAQRWRFFYARMAIKSRIKRLTVEAPPQRLPAPTTSLAENLRSFRDQFDTLTDLS